METQTQHTLRAAVVKLMRPLVRILLRNGISFRQFSDLVRWVYVDVAIEEFGIQGKKQTDSRVSVITGLSRKEVRQVKTMQPPMDQAEVDTYNRAARVIAGWRKDPDYTAEDGSPKDLSLENDDQSFAELVKQYSGDVPPRAVLDELERVGCVARTKDRNIRLTADAYVPSGDTPAILSILGTDVSDLVSTIDTNLGAPKNGGFFQRKVAYDNLPVEAAEKFRRLSARESQKLLDRMDRWLSQHDRDTRPGIDGTGRKRSGIGIYYFENE